MKSLFVVTAVAEAATGLALVAASSALVPLLLGSAPTTPVGMILAQICGVAMITLGVACWLARDDAHSKATWGLTVALLLYNVGVCLILFYAWSTLESVGIGLWPTILCHAVLTAWCVAALYKNSLSKRP